MTANTTFVSGAILTAAQMNALPWGIVDATAGGTSGRGYVMRNSANFTITTTLADVTAMTVTFTPVTGRLYRATFSARASNVSAAQNVITKLTDGSNVVKNSTAGYMIGTGDTTVYLSAVLSGLSGSTTLKIRAQVNTLSNAIFVGDSETFYSFSVEDIGPSA
jgi:hypothetical protein